MGPGSYTTTQLERHHEMFTTGLRCIHDRSVYIMLLTDILAYE